MDEPRSQAAERGTGTVRTARATPAGPPPGRYDGARRPMSGLSGKVLAVLLLLLVGALVVAGALSAYRATSTPDISGTEIAVEVVDDHTTTLVLDVTREDPSTPVYCIVRAQEYSKAEVGRREVYVPPSSEGTARIETPIATTARAYSADVYGCGEDVPDHLRR